MAPMRLGIAFLVNSHFGFQDRVLVLVAPVPGDSYFILLHRQVNIPGKIPIGAMVSMVAN